MSGYFENAVLPSWGTDGHDDGEPTHLITFENGSLSVVNVGSRTWNDVQTIAVGLRATTDPAIVQKAIRAFDKAYLDELDERGLCAEDMFFLEEAHLIHDAEQINYDIDMAEEPDDSFTNTVIGSMASAAKHEEESVDPMFQHMGYNAFAPHLDRIFRNAAHLKRDASD